MTRCHKNACEVRTVMIMYLTSVTSWIAMLYNQIEIDDAQISIHCSFTVKEKMLAMAVFF